MIPVPSFSNPFASQEDDVVRFYFEVEPPGSPSEIVFQYNPTSFSLDRQMSWEDAKAIKQPYGVLNFTGGSSDTLTFQTLFDCSEEKDGSILPTIDDLYQLTMVQIDENSISKRPPIVTLHWNELTFVGVIKSLKVDFTMFNDKGDPQRADITVTMQGRSFLTDNKKATFFAPHK